MASTVVTRPAQTLRRRETVRHSLSTKRGASIDMTSDQAPKKRKLNEPYVWDSQYILRKHKGKQPSFVLHLHRKCFRFDGHDSSYTYDGPMRPLIQHMRSQTVPHDLLEELMASDVNFYDGCLIVEVHNHRSLEEKKEGNDPASKVDDTKKLSMHNWNAHITPSPFAPYPSDAQIESDAQIAEEAQKEERKTSDKEGPTITTLVLHPTAQSQHEEMLILAKTPLADLRKKKGLDAASTPQSTLPPTPTSAGPRSTIATSQKMVMTEQEMYALQGEMLVATMPPLYLEPVKDAAEADAVLKMLEHPLHSERPPTSKERKRTTAEMAADDAQAAETERRMLIFDERLGSSARTGAGAGNSDNQAAAALGFSRFKTIDVVRQKKAEADRLKKEEESRQAQEKRQQEEQAQQQKFLAAQKKMQENNLQEQQRRQQQQLLYQRQQQQEAMAKINGQAQQTGMMPSHGHGLQSMPNGQNFQQTTAQSQASPIVAQQTPLMPHSSPMITQSSFPMMPNMSQGAGSPPRPPSAAIPNGVGMVRGPSQQTHNSLTNTPHMAQGGTPSLANAVPNRNMSQTPRLGPSSPMTGTPGGNQMPTPRLNGNLNTPQDIMLQQQMQNMQANANGGMSNTGQATNGNVINPDDVQFAQRMSRFSDIATQFRNQALAAQQQGNTAMAQQCLQRSESARAQYNSMRQQLLSTRSLAMAANQGAQTPNLNHGHPKPMQNGQMNPGGMNPQQQNLQAQQAQVMAQQQQQQQQQQILAQRQAMQRQQLVANQQLAQLAQQHGGTIPPQIIPTLPQQLQQMLRVKQQQQQQRALQIHAARQAQAQGMQMNGQGSPPTGQAGYMQNLQALRMQMQQGQQQGVNNMNNMGMNMSNIQQFTQQQQQRQQQAMRQQQQQQQQQQQGNGDLSQSFAEMQAALQRGHGQ